MAKTATTNVTEQLSKSVKTVDASLWWEPFNAVLTELENASVSSELPPTLERKLKDNHAWFLDTLSQFRSPNQKSREALDSSCIRIASHELNIQPELKDAALKISCILCLDEVQSYIVVKRSLERNSAADSMHPDFLNLVMLDYYIERQCLLKCTRQILMHALYFGSQLEGASVVLEGAQRLISDGLEYKLLSIFQDLLSSNYPEQMDFDLYTLWAEETLIEDNLILEILFLLYYESFCTCDAKCWKKLCALYEGIVTGSYNFQKLEISPEAVRSIYYAKVQLLFILIESLNLENLLQMLHDNVSFRQGSIGFSETEIQEIDTMISSFNAFEAKEVGPLILTWAVFLCLINSLPEKEENNLLTEMDHMGYVRQAFEASSLGYFLEILGSDTLKYSDGPLAGYKSVLRTFISAFIASYEISLQFEDDHLKLILDILCKIYQGEENLCIQFWDRDSFIDGPVRCLLSNLEGEFPFRSIELLRLLSALSKGAWPSECVFVLFLSSLQYTESGVLVLLLRLSQELHMQNLEELVTILDLLSRLVNFNTAICYSLMKTWNCFHNEELTEGNQQKYVRFDVVEIVCGMLKSLSPSVNGTVMTSMAVNILTKMLRCQPSRVAAMAMKGNIFDVALRTNLFDVSSNNLSSGSWLLSGRLAKMLLIDCEQSDCSMTLSVLDFTANLLETGLETDTVLALIVFSLQYVLVNHEFWRYKVKTARWKVTEKVLEVMKKCISSISYCQKLGEVVRDIMLSDSSIHSAVFRIVCTTTPSLENLYLSRVFDILDIEGLQLAISSGFEVLASMISSFSKESPSLLGLYQAILSPMTKPIPVTAAAISLISYSRDTKIQLGAARLLSVLFNADFSQSYTYSNSGLGLDDKQVVNFRKSISCILSQQPPLNEDLTIATLKLLTSAACNQPAFLTAVIAPKEYLSSQVHNASERQPKKIENDALDSTGESPSYAILQYLYKSEDLLIRKPNMLMCLLNFLKALWQGAPQFSKTLEHLKFADNFWRQLTNPLVLIPSNQHEFSDKLTEKELQNLAYRYQYLSNIFDILGYEVFMQKKLMHAEIVNQISRSPTNGAEKTEESKFTKNESLKEIISTWSKSSLSDLIKACVSWEYDDISHTRAKAAVALFAVHAMMKVRSGDSGSLSVSLVERSVTLSQKLCKLPAFSELLTQYAERGYSGGLELENLILSDIFYHIQGELDGRSIDNRPFKELLQFLMDSRFLDGYKYQHDDNCLTDIKSAYQYDTVRLKADLGSDIWDLLVLKESKEVAETLLLCLQDVNSRMLHANSKLSALRGLVTLLYMHEDNLTQDETSTGLKISEQVVSSCIDHIIQSLHATLASLSNLADAGEDALDFLTAQAELLLLLVRSVNANIAQPSCVSILKTSGYGLKVLGGCRPSRAVGTAITFLLMLILGSVESTFKDLHLSVASGIETVEASAEASNSSLGLLPVLCSYIEHPEHCTLSLAGIDLILKGFSSPATWFLVIQKHLPLAHIVQKLQDITDSKTVPVILKFLLNLARVRQGAEMLLNAGILASLRILLSDSSEGGPSSVIQGERIFSNVSDKTDKSQSIWGLSLAVLTAIIQSLGDRYTGVVDYVMACIVEKAPLVFYYISAPDFPTDGHENKRARALKSNISLSELKETQNTLGLICVLAGHWNSWRKLLQNMESQLREKSIHFLAFISRATQRPGESPRGDAPLLCHPVLKEEFEWYKKPSFVNSRNGWFALSALGCKLDVKFAPLSSRTTALVLKDNASLSPQTHLSDLVAIDIYKIAFLLLKFLCIQAESAATKAEEVGFVDLAHFPELPMPDILHGLQVSPLQIFIFDPLIMFLSYDTISNFTSKLVWLYAITMWRIQRQFKCIFKRY
ncbi:hypothetical protein ACS0TY_003962 [Phlomoides rotata]